MSGMLDGKVILVTGAAGGIGTAAAELFAREGARLALSARSADKLTALVNAIKGETYTKLLMLNLEYDPKPPVIGGSVNNTNKGLVNYMSQMYDSALGSK